jgi:hypothetical protein
MIVKQPSRRQGSPQAPHHSTRPARRVGVIFPTRAMSRLATLGAALALAASFLVFQAGSSAQAAGVFAQLRTAAGLCIQPTTAADGAPLVTAACGTSTLQNWWPMRKSGTRYAWVNQGSGGCIYLNTNSAWNGAPIVNAVGGNSCNVSNSEWDTHTSNLQVITKLESRVGGRNTGFCLNSPGYGTPGDRLILWTCSPWANQTFFWVG